MKNLLYVASKTSCILGGYILVHHIHSVHHIISVSVNFPLVSLMISEIHVFMGQLYFSTTQSYFYSEKVCLKI